jgi:hypothetical protein
MVFAGFDTTAYEKSGSNSPFAMRILTTEELYTTTCALPNVVSISSPFSVVFIFLRLPRLAEVACWLNEFSDIKSKMNRNTVVLMFIMLKM